MPGVSSKKPRRGARYGVAASQLSLVPGADPDTGPGTDEVPGRPEAAFAGLLADVRRALRTIRTPFDAELWGSELLGMLSLLDPEGLVGADAVAAQQVLVEAAEESCSPESLALLRVLAAVGPTPARAEAASAADRLSRAGVPDQRWAGVVGAPSIGDCWRYGDVLGYQESITVCFAYGAKRHALSVLIDHGLGGGMKDCWATEDVDAVLTQTRAVARDNPAVQFELIDAAEARSRLAAAISAPECPEQPEQIEDIALARALLHARVALLPDLPKAALTLVTGQPADDGADLRHRTNHQLNRLDPGERW
ncbi:MAG: hypothetical protein HYR62_05935 [Actinobacteria bacterium]|nr:hypothetical protein [Actinomycetota bacterium]